MKSMRPSIAVSFALIAAIGCGASKLDDSSGGLSASSGTVTFVLTMPTDFSFCDQVSCSEPLPQHLTIQTPDGEMLSWPAGTCGTTDCGSCAPLWCPVACPVAHGAPYTGETVAWDGSYLRASTCGASSTTCAQPRYAAPGPYVAQFCATQGTIDQSENGLPTCTNTASTICTTAPFTYPSAEPIQIELPVYHPL